MYVIQTVPRVEPKRTIEEARFCWYSTARCNRPKTKDCKRCRVLADFSEVVRNALTEVSHE